MQIPEQENSDYGHKDNIEYQRFVLSCLFVQDFERNLLKSFGHHGVGRDHIPKN